MNKVSKSIKKLSKTAKIVISLALVLVIAGGATLIYFLTKKDPNIKHTYDKIYQNYTSITGFSRAEEKLRLKGGIKITSYDMASGIFVIEKTIVIDKEKDEDEEGNTIVLYGFANYEKVIAEPEEHRYLGVLAVKDNYAIVASGNYEEEKVVHRVGLVRFDNNNVYEYGFYHEYKEYLPMVSFQGDYIAMFAGQYYTNPESASYTVFYDYKSSDSLLEVFKVEATPNYIYDLMDNHLVAADLNKVYFYDIHKINASGYLIKQDTYYPFADEEKYTPSYVSFSINYLGNNWFLRKAIFYQEQPFLGYKYIMQGDSASEVLYVEQKNDRYNAAINQAYTSEILLVDKVANKYSDDVFAGLAVGANLIDIIQGLNIMYSEPAFPPSSFVKDGYSIIYNYFFPDYSDLPETSYVIVDKNGDIVRQEDMYMPPLFVDGIGVQNPSINYPNLLGDALVHYFNGEKKVLKEYSSDEYTYESTFVHDGMMVVYQYKFSGGTPQPMAGAFDMQKGEQSIPFMYDNLSMFVGGYAIGAVADLSANLQYYRVSKDGVRTPITHIYSVKHGVYITASSGRKALYSFDGTQLIPNRCDDIYVYEMFLHNNKLLESIAITEEGDDTVIYTLI